MIGRLCGYRRAATAPAGWNPEGAYGIAVNGGHVEASEMLNEERRAVLGDASEASVEAGVDLSGHGIRTCDAL